jgi:hypothetical protein
MPRLDNKSAEMALSERRKIRKRLKKAFIETIEGLDPEMQLVTASSQAILFSG